MKKIYLTLIILCAFGCSYKKSKAGNLSNFDVIENNLQEDANGLYNTKKLENIHYAVVKLDREHIERLFKSRFDSQVGYADFTCFMFYVTIKNQADIAAYDSPFFNNLSEKIQYLSFSIKDDFLLEVRGRQYRCLN